MKILIDIVHPADLNFYKYAVEYLNNKGHKIIFTVLRRGNLPEKVKNDYKGFEIVEIGKHGKNIFSKIINITLREIQLFFYLIKNRVDKTTAFGFYPGLPARLLGIKSIHFHDDKEYKKNFNMTKIFASKFISLCKIKPSKKVRFVNSYKELAYLHPSLLREDKKETAEFFKSIGIKKEKYIYIRDVANISLNYSKNALFDYTKILEYAKNKGYKIIYDPEIENEKYPYAKRIKKFNFNNMVAIKKYAALVITSGDTVFREAAILGTPAIYTSDRDMEINRKIFQDKIAFKAKNSQELLKIGKDILKPNAKKKFKKMATKSISKLEDMTKIIVEEILN